MCIASNSSLNGMITAPTSSKAISTHRDHKAVLRESRKFHKAFILQMINHRGHREP